MPSAAVFDQWQGVKTGWWKDPATGKNVVVNKQDCTDVLRLTAHSRNGDQAHNAWGHPLLGSVPVVEYYDALARHGIDVRTWFAMPLKERKGWHRRMFRDEWSKFRATDKRF